MPTQTLLPDALLAHAGWAGSPAIATIDEDPDTAGGDWLDPATQSTSPTARVGFPTPTGNPSGVQTFKARLGLIDAVGTSPTARIDLYEAGALKASGTAQTISTTKASAGQVISQTFDLATTPLTTANGSGVEALVVVTASGGKASNQRSASLDAVNWDTVTYTTPEIVAHWRLGEASGTDAADETARHLGTYVGGPLLGQPGLRAADTNTAVSFDGVDDKVSVPSNAAFDLTTGRTVRAWVRATDLTRKQALVARSSSGGPYHWGLMLLSTGQFYWWVYNGSTPGDLVAGVASGAVQHVVGTHDGAVMRLYVDGVQVGSLASTIVPGTAAQAVTLGAEGDFNFFKGALDEVAVDNYALTAAEVLEHYQAGTTTGDTTPPVTTLGTPTRTTISAVAGWNTTDVTITAGEAFVEYMLRRVPAETSTRTEGTLIETATIAATTSLTATVTNGELAGVEGPNLVKAWTRDAAGNWSTN